MLGMWVAADMGYFCPDLAAVASPVAMDAHRAHGHRLWWAMGSILHFTES